MILPRQNETTLLEEVPSEIRNRLTVYLVSDVTEVLRIALAESPPWHPPDAELEPLFAGTHTR